jgi:hypothetical protein
LNDVVAIVRDRLAVFLPPPPAGLPPPAVSLAGVRERAVGLGNRRGVETHGAFGVLELKGLQLDATARFELWAASANQANALVETLQQALLAAREGLFGEGFLRLEAAETSTVELVDVNVWRRTADYRLLFEHRFFDTDGAQSLIARIPIHNDPQQPDSPFRETTVVTDEMARWDNEAAPALVVRGRRTIDRMGVLDFQSAAFPTAGVLLTRTFDGAVGVPASLALNDFLEQLSDPVNPNRHAVSTVASLEDFLESFTEVAEASLGDWDEIGGIDVYKSRELTFGRTITDLVVDASDTAKVSSATKPFARIDVGHSINITSGSGFTTGRYRVVHVDGSNAATLDDSCGAAGSTNGSGKIDRPLVLPSRSDRFEVAYQAAAFDQVGVLYLRAVAT